VTVAVIVQARIGSTRLPAKVLLPLPTGRNVLEEVLFRCHQIPGVDRVVCAVSEAPGNQILLPSIIRGRATLVIGSETDVLSRYAYAASELRADIIVRITADCPLLDPEVCGEVLKLRDTTDADYASNCWPARHFPHGWDCEVFTVNALRRANAEATESYDREHVGPAVRRVVPIERQALLKAMEDRSHIRWTLDTLEDYVRIWSEFKRREEAA
jgi:spore coat polysaccharide biosynthesis protein SpsF